MEIAINPKYLQRCNYVRGIPDSFEQIEHIIQNNRNDVRVDHVGDHKLAIKSFKGMYFTNQIAYSMFRKSKAKRSYETSFRLLSKGFIVPEPIAFIDCYQYGFLTQSYFISAFYENTSFNEMLNYGKSKSDLLSSFARFTATLHEAGIHHNDYSNGNILCNEINGEITFGMVDLNRVRFGKVGFDRGVRNFSTLAISEEDLESLVDQYAKTRGFPVGNSVIDILNLKKRRSASSRWRKRAKSIFFPWRLRKETIPA